MSDRHNCLILLFSKIFSSMKIILRVQRMSTESSVKNYSICTTQKMSELNIPKWKHLELHISGKSWTNLVL